MRSATGPRSFIDSIEAEAGLRISKMRAVYEVDPTPALKGRIDAEAASSERKLRTLRRAHERFGRLMELTDDELRTKSSSERGEPMIGDPELIDKISKRKMGEAEYLDLLYGPDILKK